MQLKIMDANKSRAVEELERREQLDKHLEEYRRKDAEYASVSDCV